MSLTNSTFVFYFYDLKMQLDFGASVSVYKARVNLLTAINRTRVTTQTSMLGEGRVRLQEFCVFVIAKHYKGE